MAQSIVDMFFACGGYDTDETGASDYVATSSVTGTYVPLALDLFNGITEEAAGVDFAATSTSGNIFTDKILAEMSAYFADQDFDTMAVDPETGKIINRHYDTFLILLKLKYGVVVKNGTIMMPQQATGTRACVGYETLENKE